jgi:hypothetical protein
LEWKITKWNKATYVRPTLVSPITFPLSQQWRCTEVPNRYIALKSINRQLSIRE